ncbi:MAG: TlpA family protein disulfide reductase [Gemmataceae bacterium]|nr:TlpA family protein disulfide reductase [Gemmataceae bacterium]
MRVVSTTAGMLLLGAALAGCTSAFDSALSSVKKGNVSGPPTIDRPAPEIEAVDGDGKSFKLSDYRGKVVMLDFWATWCPPCVGMLPHERSLLKKYEGRPFALLGVDNTADGGPPLKEFIKDGRVTWPNWHDDKARIAGEWGIKFYPTIFLIDHKGVIRDRQVGVPEAQFDQLLDKLVREAEKDKAS